MNGKVWLSGLSVLLLGACAHYPHHCCRISPPDPLRPEVTLTKSGQLVVNQTPVVIPMKQDGPVTITYRLPPGSGLAFDRADGVKVVGQIKDEKGEFVPTKDRNGFVLDKSNNILFECGPAPAGTDAGQRASSLGTSAGQVRERLIALRSDSSKEPVDPQRYVCLFDDRLKSADRRGFWAYEINVVGPNGAKFRLDPTWYPDGASVPY